MITVSLSHLLIKLVSKQNEHTNLFLNKVKLYSVQQTTNVQANALTLTKVW